MASGSGRQEEGPMSFLEQDVDSPERAARPAPRLFVDSEVGPLRRVLLHRPDLELRRLTPANKDELRFDDVLWVRRAHEEHNAFADTLAEAGVEVLYLQELLAEVLADADVQVVVRWHDRGVGTSCVSWSSSGVISSTEVCAATAALVSSPETFRSWATGDAPRQGSWMSRSPTWCGCSAARRPT
jgi:hypothetical protein